LTKINTSGLTLQSVITTLRHKLITNSYDTEYQELFQRTDGKGGKGELLLHHLLRGSKQIHRNGDLVIKTSEGDKTIDIKSVTWKNGTVDNFKYSGTLGKQIKVLTAELFSNLQLPLPREVKILEIKALRRDPVNNGFIADYEDRVAKLVLSSQTKILLITQLKNKHFTGGISLQDKSMGMKLDIITQGSPKFTLYIKQNLQSIDLFPSTPVTSTPVRKPKGTWTLASVTQAVMCKSSWADVVEDGGLYKACRRLSKTTPKKTFGEFVGLKC